MSMKTFSLMISLTILLQMVNNLIERFRGNFIVGHPKFGENLAPFEEEEWSNITIGDLVFKVCFMLLFINF